MSLRPPLHVSTFNWRTVVSMFGRLCHLFVHALSSLQVANAQCRTLRSLAPCLRAAREKHRFAAGKNIGTEKNTFGSRKKTPCSGKKRIPQREKKRQQKMPLRSGKNSKQQKKHLAAAQKHLCSRKNAFWRQREKTVRGREKNQQQRKSSFPTQKVAATEKTHFRNGKKQQPSSYATNY